MGSALSYILSIGATFLISSLSQKYIWGNKKSDGTPKSPWPVSPNGLPFFSKGWPEYENDGYHALTRWSKQLGDLFSVQLIQKRILVLNSAEVAKKLFVDLDQYNSTRMSSDEIEQIMTNHGKTVFTAGFTTYWTRLRRAIYIVIGRIYVSNFFDFFNSQSEKLCSGIAHQAETNENNQLSANEIRQLVDMIAMDNALTLTIGDHHQHDPAMMLSLIQTCHDIEKKQSEKYHRLETFFAPLASILRAKTWLVEPDQTISTDFHKNLLEKFQAWLQQDIDNNTKSKKVSNNNSVLYISQSLLNIEPSNNDPEPTQLTNDEISINLVHITFHAYTYLSSSIFTLIQRLATEPDLQTRLFQQDPNEKLAHAFIKESLRMDPPMRLIAHSSRVDYDLELDNNDRKYRVDTDSELVMNLDAIHQDDRYYKEPKQFQPDRFLESDATAHILDHHNDKTTTTASNHLAFGAGRRSCIAADASEELMTKVLIRLVKTFELDGGDVIEKIEKHTNIWAWTGRTETKGSSIVFKKRDNVN